MSGDPSVEPRNEAPTQSGANNGSDRYHFAIDIGGTFAIFMLNAHGSVETWNSTAEQVTGYPAHEILGKNLSLLYPPPEGGALCTDLLARAADTGRVSHEGWHIRKDGTRFWASVLVTAQHGEEGDLAGFTAITRDLSAQKLTEQRLRRAEENLRMMIDSVKDYAIFMLNPIGEVISWNDGAQRIKGYSADEIIGQNFSVFFPPDSRATGMPQRLLQTAALQGRVEAQGWRLRRDGSRFWADVVISAIHDDAGELRGFCKITRDLTERKRLEQLEHVGELAAAQETARENEKARIARELHDDLGQQLTAMKMGTQHLMELIVAESDPHEMEKIAQTLVSQTDAMVVSVRRISANLRPTILDDLGLLPAIEWLADEFSRRYGVQAHTLLSAEKYPFSGLAATAIFRIVQEALTNVARHAGAKSVTISVRQTQAHCEVCIQDDGRGLRPGEPQRADAFGLLGMRERIRQLNGTAVFGAGPRGGFSIKVTLPVDSIARK